MPTWLAWVLKFFATPATSTAPSVAVDVATGVSTLASIPWSQIASQPLQTVEDVTAALANIGVPYAGDVLFLEQLLADAVILKKAGVLTLGPIENPDGGAHSKG